MIVKNETKVIKRCLESVRPIIDYWVIVDTGSTDGTQKMIKEYMKDVPGELYERPWINFGHNRNEALELAKGKGDYVLIIDADEVLEFQPNFKLPVLDKDFYYITTQYGGTKYGRVQLVSTKLDTKWVGVLHEVLDVSKATSSGTLENVANVVRTDGARSQDPRKFHKDAELLEKALLEEPNNARNVFYLAQSYRDAGEYASSLKNYQKRVEMGGWDQEVFWSMLQIGILQDTLDMPSDVVANSFYNAYHFRPTRAEPLYRLANYYRRKGNYAAGYIIADVGLKLPPSDDVLFVEHWVSDYGMLLEKSICAYWIGNYKEALKLGKIMLAKKDLPSNVRECVLRNQGCTETQLSRIKIEKIQEGQKQLEAVNK